MAGNRASGLSSRDRLLAIDPDWYAKIGAIGGKKKVPKGFALMSPEKHKGASSKGGLKSKRTKSEKNTQDN